MPTCSSALSESFSRSERCYFSKNNINPYLLILTVFIISTSLAGTEVRFTGTRFIVNVIHHHTWSLVFFCNSSFTCWTWLAFPLITKWTQVIADSQRFVFPQFCKDFYNVWLDITSACQFVPVHLVRNVFYSPHTNPPSEWLQYLTQLAIGTNAATKTSSSFSALTFFTFMDTFIS